MILVTSAAGFSGLNVTRALRARGVPVRAFVRSETQKKRVLALGATEVVLGDLRDAQVVRAALRDVDAVYFICPRFAEDEPTMGALWIAQAEAVGLQRFVYQGVAHPYIQAMPHHWDKLQVQLMLEQSRLPYTVLQPSNYMRNLTWAWDKLVEEGVYRLPYSPDSPITWVDADDVAEVAARVLTEPGHDGGAYELCGTPGGVTRTVLCESISRRLGRHIAAARVDWQDWKTLPRYHSWSEGQMRRLKAMFDYYDQHGFRVGNTKVLDMLLGRPCTSYEAYLDSLLALPASERQAVL